PGTNIIAIQGFNGNLTSSDFLMDAQMATVFADLVPPTLTSKAPPPGTISNLTQITVVFSEPVTGVNASDLLVAGQPATGVMGSDTTYVFSFPQPPYGTVAITWAANHGITDLGIPPNPFDPALPGHTWQYTLIDKTPPFIVSFIPVTNSIVKALTSIE